MRLVRVQFAPWDKEYNFEADGLDLSVGDQVVVKTDMGMEIGVVSGAGSASENPEEVKCACQSAETCPHQGREVKPVLRKASPVDLEKLISKEEKDKAMKFAKQMAERYGLVMKIVDIHFSFDGSRVTIAFIADGRVDFRELVKDLTRHFNRTVRMYQIGIRDEARVAGDCGPCGRELCCAGFLNDLVSINSEMADMQQCAHRGSDRLSGVCGRLKCCLVYEVEGYEHLAGKLPPLGARVNVDGQRGVVVGHHILKQAVNVEFPPEKEGEKPTVVEVDLNRHKKGKQQAA